MMDRKLLARLSDAHSAPGYEGEVKEIIRKELEKVCDEVFVDKIGNLIAKKGVGEKKLMLDAHMDEIGLIVKSVDKDGFIRFTTLGGFFDQSLLNQRVVLHTAKGRVVGVIGSKPPHFMEEEEKKKVVKSKDMFIDIGVESRKKTRERGIEVGDFITIERSFKAMGSDFITGKAFDDRLGCYAMLEVMRRVEAGDCELYAVGSVQEEVGLKGARIAAYRLYPDLAIALDVTTTGDYPGVSEEKSTNRLGEGPVITIVDSKGRGLITSPEVKELLVSTAKKYKIPYQVEVGEGGTTNATAIHLTREGIPSGVVSVPVRYAHSPVEVARLKDLEKTIELAVRAIEEKLHGA